jgi:hypothetical protein
MLGRPDHGLLHNRSFAIDQIARVTKTTAVCNKTMFLGSTSSALLQRIKHPTRTHIQSIKLKNFPDRLSGTLVPSKQLWYDSYKMSA